MEDEWAAWRANNIKLMMEGWTLCSNYMDDGSIREYAKKNGIKIDNSPPKTWRDSNVTLSKPVQPSLR